MELAGTVQVWEDSQTVDGLGVRVATSGRLQQYRVAPDLVRSLQVGEAVAIHAGRWAHVAIANSTPTSFLASRRRASGGLLQPNPDASSLDLCAYLSMKGAREQQLTTKRT